MTDRTLYQLAGEPERPQTDTRCDTCLSWSEPYQAFIDGETNRIITQCPLPSCPTCGRVMATEQLTVIYPDRIVTQVTTRGDYRGTLNEVR